MSGHGTPRVPPGVVTIPPGAVAIPANWAMPPASYLAAQALPAAGAFTAIQAKQIPVGSKRLTAWIQYTRGAVGGFPRFQMTWHAPTGAVPSPLDTPQGRTIVLDLGSFAAAAPNATTNAYEEQLNGPVPSADPLSYELTFSVPPYVSGFDLQCAEAGVVGTPGTIKVDFTLDG